MQPFVTSKQCTYQQHSARIEKMIQEGLHDGKAWTPESHARYAELEQEDFAPKPAVIAPPEPTIAELKARIVELETEVNHHIDSPDPSIMRNWGIKRKKDWYKLRSRKLKREIQQLVPILQGLKEEFNCESGEALLTAVRETLDGLHRRVEEAEEYARAAGEFKREAVEARKILEEENRRLREKNG